ncbi:MAG: CDF family Co(II)/Ni(II) efflux transporter DmeF [Gallionella sp.]
MDTQDLSRWTHLHAFNKANPAAERSTRTVMWITAAMMVVEIWAGWWFNSMALLADGWHMSSHALAIGLSAFSYAAARRYANDPRFAFGTWKIEILGGYTSALFLLGIAAMMVFGSVDRLFSPQPIHYQAAIGVAVVGLLVNIVCAMILGNAHHHGHSHGDEPEHHHHHDLNLKAAYLHVLADAATSVLAIVALVGGLLYGWSWLDPVMGIVGALLVAIWAKKLLVQTGAVLLDREMDHAVVDEIRQVIESSDNPDRTRITDLHVWRVGKDAYACAVGIVTHSETITPEWVREQLCVHEEIVHTTIEIHRYA